MTLRSRAGFSLVELMVSLMILTAGVLILAGGSLFVTRDLVRSRQSTVAAAAAQARLAELRATANGTVPPCTSPRFASATGPVSNGGVTVTWTVPEIGLLRTIRVVTTYQLGQGRARTDTLVGVIAC
jgi:prepilin-type N-terminal cleavage/methylation domain-containing protein